MVKMEELKKQRKYLRSGVTKLLGKENILNSEETIKLQVLKEQLFEKRKELKDVDNQLLILIKGTDEEIEKEYETSEEYQEKIIEVIKKIEINLQDRERGKYKSDEVVKIVHTEDKTNKKTFSARLPKIELPIFEGDINSWFSFWQIFEANIDQRDDLSVIEKLTYLLSLLRGEPARMVSGFAATAENYPDIIKILHTQYGNKEKIVDLIMKQILEMKPVTSIAQISELKTLITELSIKLRNLNNLGINTNDCSPILNSKIKQLVPSEFLLLYEREERKEEEKSTDDLINFLQKEIKYREKVTPSLNPRASIFKPRSYASSWRSPIRQTPTFMPRMQPRPHRRGMPLFLPRQPWVNRPQHPHESRNVQNISQPSVPPTMPNKAGVVCFKCDQVGHYARECISK